jgi:hypothetical protein
MDFTARRRKAAADRPFRQTEADRKAEADALKQSLAHLKKAKPLDCAKVAETGTAHDAAIRAARDAAKKAEAMESYDLSSVNAKRKADKDKRPPGELLNLIEVKGRKAAEALAALRKPEGVSAM